MDDSWCRLCGAENRPNLSLRRLEPRSAMISRIVYLTSIKIDPSDGLSHSICADCDTVINDLHGILLNFKRRQRDIVENRRQATTTKIATTKEQRTKRQQSTNSDIAYCCMFCSSSFSDEPQLKRHIIRRHRMLQHLCRQMTKPCYVRLQKLPFRMPQTQAATMSEGWIHFNEKNIMKFDPNMPLGYMVKKTAIEVSSDESDNEPILCKKQKISDSSSDTTITTTTTTITNTKAGQPKIGENGIRVSRVESPKPISTPTYKPPMPETNVVKSGFLTVEKPSPTLSYKPSTLAMNVVVAQTVEKAISTSTHKPSEPVKNGAKSRSPKMATVPAATKPDDKPLEITKDDIHSIIQKFVAKKCGVTNTEDEGYLMYLKQLYLHHTISVDWTPIVKNDQTVKEPPLIYKKPNGDKIAVEKTVEFSPLTVGLEQNEIKLLPPLLVPISSASIISENVQIPKIVSTFSIPKCHSKIEKPKARCKITPMRPKMIVNEDNVGVDSENISAHLVRRPMIKCKPTELLMGHNSMLVNQLNTPQVLNPGIPGNHSDPPSSTNSSIQNNVDNSDNNLANNFVILPDYSNPLNTPYSLAVPSLPTVIDQNPATPTFTIQNYGSNQNVGPFVSVAPNSVFMQNASNSASEQNASTSALSNCESNPSVDTLPLTPMQLGRSQAQLEQSYKVFDKFQHRLFERFKIGIMYIRYSHLIPSMRAIVKYGIILKEPAADIGPMPITVYLFVHKARYLTITMHDSMGREPDFMDWNDTNQRYVLYSFRQPVVVKGLKDWCAASVEKKAVLNFLQTILEFEC